MDTTCNNLRKIKIYNIYNIKSIIKVLVKGLEIEILSKNGFIFQLGGLWRVRNGRGLALVIGFLSVISGTISTCSSFDFDSFCGGSDVLGAVVGGFLELETCFVNF